MAWLVKLSSDGTIERDAAGKELKKVAMRGRPPKGWTRVDDDMQPKASTSNKPSRPKQDPDTPILKSLLVQFNDDGSLMMDEAGDMVHRDVSRGRPPKGWTKVQADEFGELYDMDGKSLETGEPCPDPDPDLAPEQQNTAVDVEENEEPSAVEAVIEQPSTTVIAQTQEIPATRRTTLSEFQTHIDASRIEELDGVITMLACTIDTAPEADYLTAGMALSRIDVDQPNGDIKIWRERPKGNPTIILKGALEPEGDIL